MSHVFGNSTKPTYADSGAGDNCENWPYAQQKSLQAIRDEQAAYRRELDKQVEEKKSQQEKRRLPGKRPSRSTLAEPQPSMQQSVVAPSISLDAFKNTGYLPAWFDPIKNNPIHSNINDSSFSTSSCPPCGTMGPPEPPIQHSNQFNTPPPSQHHQSLARQSSMHLNDSSKLPASPNVLGTPPGTDFEGDARTCAILNQTAPASLNTQIKYYIVSEEMLSQMQQMSSPCIDSSQTTQAYLGHDQQLERQGQLTPPLQSQQSQSGILLPPHPAKQFSTSQKNTLYYVQDSDQGHQWASTQLPLPPPTCFAQDYVQPRFYDHDHQQADIEIIDHSSPGSGHSRRSVHQQDAEKTKSSIDGFPAPHVSQTADQLPTGEIVKTYYKSQLAQQIEERRRSQLEKQTKDMEEEAKLQKKIEEDQKRMEKEYEEEKKLQKLKQEECLRRQELIVKEKERFEREAEELREKKRQQRRPQGLTSANFDTSENDHKIPLTTEYLSPADLTVCAASTWSAETREKSIAEASSSEEDIEVTPRPRTVILGQCEQVVGKPSKMHNVVEPNTRSKSTSYINHRPNLPKSTRAQENSKAKSSGRTRMDVHFLANVRRALVAEDQRVQRSMKERHRLYLSF